MDDGVNAHLLQRDVGLESPRFVAESSCRYLMPLAYPTQIDVGLSIEKCADRARAAPNMTLSACARPGRAVARGSCSEYG